MIIHPQARTTPQIRAEIQASTQLTQKALAQKYNVTKQTIRKWQNRDQNTDKTHRPHHLQTTLSDSQEKIAVELRKTLFLPLDDLLVITREFVNPAASRSGLSRTLARYGVSNLNEMKRVLEQNSEEKTPKKHFKDYAPGFVHIDIKYLPKMEDEDRRQYLFVAIDRASRWVHMEVFPDKRAHSARQFLDHVVNKAPFVITKLLTDNGKEFTDRFIPNGEREPTGSHAFDRGCHEHQIEHRLIKPAHPQTNGMVERFNGRISDILKSTHFPSSKALAETIAHYLRIYNYHIPQKNIGHQTPIMKLKEWQKLEPELFKKRVYDLSGLDSYLTHSELAC